MKKLHLFLTGVAAMSLMACGNDDLENGGNLIIDPVENGDVAYMTVNITDANATGRSTEDGGYEYGTELDESKVNTADFYFFNENGTYAELEAEIWREGDYGDAINPNDPAGTKNLEHLGQNVIVLKGLKSNTYPKYMLTVLNQPVNYKPEATLAATAKALYNWGNQTGNFMMTTTSFFGGNDPNHEDVSTTGANTYFANVLKPENFMRQAPGTDPDADNKANNIVKVYVERLAAKVQVTIGMTKATGKGVADDLYELPVTVSGGDDNENKGDNELAATKLYVKFSKWGLNATAPQSYFSKNLDDWSASTKFNGWEVWNSSDYHRSFWGKSVYYTNSIDTENVLNYTNYKSLDKDFTNSTAEGAVKAAYCNEYTNTPGIVTKTENEMDGGNPVSVTKVVPAKTTSVLLQAEICDKDGVGLDLVLHNGVLFKENAYIAYVINNAGPYYTKSETGEGADKKVIFTKYTDTTGLTCSEEDGSATKVECTLTALPTTLYKLKSDAINTTEEGSFTEVTLDEYKTSIETAQTGMNATRFNGGRMYYTIAIEHEAPKKPDGTDARAKNDEGYYGVVRNHWYQLNITSLKRLGHAVNNPEEIIIPQPETPEYYLGAQINILSWKVIKQNVSLD